MRELLIVGKRKAFVLPLFRFAGFCTRGVARKSFHIYEIASFQTTQTLNFESQISHFKFQISDISNVKSEI